MKYLILADLHGNIRALNTVLNHPDVQDIDRIIIAGDLIGGFHSNELINRVRELDAITICGNGEKYLLGYLKSDNKYESLRWAPVRFIRSQLSEENIEFISKLPESIELTDSGKVIHIHHADPLGKYETFYPERDLDRVNEIISSIEADVFITAHTHVQWTLKKGDTHAINPGSVGYPFFKTNKTDFTILEISSAVKIKQYSVDIDTSRYIEEIVSSGYLKKTGPIGKAILAMMSSGKPVSRYFIEHIYEKFGLDNKSIIDDKMLISGSKTFNWNEYNI